MLALLFGSALVFTALGGGVGYLLGRYLPGYYRSVFRNGQSPDFDPVAAGVGQGVTQGLVGGVVIGVVLIVAMLWFRLRAPQSPDARRSGTLTRARAARR
ncbi:MAG: hypothetical protein QM811_02540 [Pirellulales bacterium]